MALTILAAVAILAVLVTATKQIVDKVDEAPKKFIAEVKKKLPEEKPKINAGIIACKLKAQHAGDIEAYKKCKEMKEFIKLEQANE